MVGIIDVGGGLKGAYTSGVYDRMLDDGVKLQYGIGVSAGSANMITYFAGQRGRSFRYYRDYSFRKQYMSAGNYIRKGSYIDLDYIYSTLTNDDGEDPLDYAAFAANPARFIVVATDAETGKPKYFEKSDFSLNNYDVLKASCCIPGVCRAYPIGGRSYFDGGISDPIPYKRAFADGCDKLVILLTRAPDYHKEQDKNLGFMRLKLRKYPKAYACLASRHTSYNAELDALAPFVADGRVLLLGPEDSCGVSTLKKSVESLEKLYSLGLRDGAKIKAFAEA